MSLLPEEAGYLEQVQAYFLAFRGDGVSLSPLDAELLQEWRTRGVPYPVVCRGIRIAAEQVFRNEGTGRRLRTLRACRASVEREHRKWEGLSSGRGEVAAAPAPEDYATKRLKKTRALLKKALDEAPTPAHSRALERALSLLPAEAGTPREVAHLVARADEVLALGFVRGLPFQERRKLVRAARELAGPRPAESSPRARKDALRAHLVAIARSEGQLVALA